jgi:hypothetical protein
MADKRKANPIIIGLVAAGFLAIFVLWVLSLMGILSLPLTYKNVKTPRDLGAFLDSRRDEMRGLKVNQHLIEIGKRPSMQIIEGYDKIMYQMRPYRQVHFKFRNFTKAEVMDFCTNITADGLEDLRAKIASGKGFTPAWQGKIQGSTVAIVKVTMFSYLVKGLADKPVFMGQVELAKRLGMDDPTILSLIIPAQERWLQGFSTSPSMDSPYPLQFLTNSRDEFIEWLGIPRQ